MRLGLFLGFYMDYFCSVIVLPVLKKNIDSLFYGAEICKCVFMSPVFSEVSLVFFWMQRILWLLICRVLLPLLQPSKTFSLLSGTFRGCSDCSLAFWTTPDMKWLFPFLLCVSVAWPQQLHSCSLWRRSGNANGTFSSKSLDSLWKTTLNWQKEKMQF